MNSVRLTLLVILVLLFSWPIITQATLPIWVMWLYPFFLWALVILYTIFYDNADNEKPDDK